MIWIKVVARMRNSLPTGQTLRRFQEGNAMHRYGLALLIVVSQPSSAFVAELPKEGSYDYTACWSGVSNIITFSKTHTGSSYELMGAIRSNPPGGMFDKNTFRCVGMGASFDGKITGANICETIDADGDKRLSSFSTGDGKVTRTHGAGTGK